MTKNEKDPCHINKSSPKHSTNVDDLKKDSIEEIEDGIVIPAVGEGQDILAVSRQKCREESVLIDRALNDADAGIDLVCNMGTAETVKQVDCVYEVMLANFGFKTPLDKN